MDAMTGWYVAASCSAITHPRYMKDVDGVTRHQRRRRIGRSAGGGSGARLVLQDVVEEGVPVPRVARRRRARRVGQAAARLSREHASN